MKRYSIYLLIVQLRVQLGVTLGLFCFAIPQAYALEWPNIKPAKIGSNTYVIEHGPHDEDKKVSHGFQTILVLS